MRDAVRIKKALKMVVDKKDTCIARTKAYVKQGIMSLSVWIDKNRLFQALDSRTCIFSMCINHSASQKLIDTIRFVESVAREIPYLSLGEWLVREVVFSVVIPVNQAISDLYRSLLLKGRFGRYHIRKTDKSGFIVDGNHVRFEYGRFQKYNHEWGGIYGVKLSLTYKKGKLKAFGSSQNSVVHSRKATELAEKIRELEISGWDYYVDKFWGEGDYYTLSEAERIIDESDLTSKNRNKVLVVLKGIAYYKGVDTFLDHISNQCEKTEFHESIVSINAARKYITSAEKLGIDVVTIPRRDAVTYRVKCLPNIKYFIDEVIQNPDCV